MPGPRDVVATEGTSLRTTRLEKSAALALIALPASVLVLFAIGEMAGGEPSGAQHFLQAAPLVVLAALAWRFPQPVGYVLLGGAALLFAGWLLLVVGGRVWEEDDGAGLALWVAAGALFFLLPALAGWLLLRSAPRR